MIINRLNFWPSAPSIVIAGDCDGCVASTLWHSSLQRRDLAISVFVGTQPLSTQAPPKCLRSAIAGLQPAPPRCTASAWPA